MKQYDFVVIGSGIAGLSFALKATKHGSVAVITKRKGADSNTAWAQGGIACVTSDEDSVELHVRTGLNVRHADEQLRGTIALPNGIGKTLRVIVFAKGDMAEQAKAAGADEVGGEAEVLANGEHQLLAGAGPATGPAGRSAWRGCTAAQA